MWHPMGHELERRNRERTVNPTLFNAIIAIAALAVIFGIWVGVHLLARYRLGARQIGCRGPVTDDFGNEVCCHTGEPCEGESECASAPECGDEAPAPPESK